MRHWLVTVILLALASACARQPLRAPVGHPALAMAIAPAVVLQTLREASRMVLERHCGRCHLPNLPTSNVTALGVFDLSQPNYESTMSDTALANALTRLQEDERVGKDEAHLFERFVWQLTTRPR